MTAMLQPFPAPGFLDGDGEARRLLREHDWAATSIGAPQSWPAALKALVEVILGSSQPMFVVWGSKRSLLYNDPYAKVLANKHPALGRDFLAVWSEIRGDLAPLVERAYAGEATRMDDIPLLMERKGHPEPTWWHYSYTPVRDADGLVGGFLCACHEVTGQILGQRRQAFRLRLDERLRGISEPREVMNVAVEELGRHLGASRAGYSEAGADDRTLDFHACYAVGVEPIHGSHRIDDFGPESIVRHRLGGTEIVADVQTHPAQAGMQHVWEAIETRAYVSVPLIEGGRFRASLYVDRREPHGWTSDEVQLIEEVAQRTWSAVERARAETARDRLAALSAAQGRILELAVSDAPLSKALEEIVATVEGLSTSGVLASVLLLDVDGVHLRHGAAPSLPEPYNRAIDGIAIGENVGSCGSAAHGNAPVFVTDITTDPRWAEFGNLAHEHGLRACWSIPIRSRQGDVLGTFAMYHREPREPQAADLEIVDFVVRTAGLVLERAWAEETVRRSGARYRQIVEGAENFAIVTLDARGVITGWNTGAERIIRYSEREAVGRSLDLFFVPEDVSAGVPDLEMATARRDGRASDDRWHLRKDGTRFWGSGLMMPLAADEGGFVTIFRDRTAEHEADATRRESEERLRLAAENAEVGFWDVDEVNQVLHWPPLVKAMFGISPDVPVTMRDFYEGLHSEDREFASAAYAAAADPSRRAMYDVEYRTIGKEDGVARWVAAKGRGVFDDDGRCLRVAGTAVDVTRRKATEADLAESRERLRGLNASLEQRVAETAADLDRVWRNASDMFFVVAKSGILERMNPATTAILGWTEGEMIGRSVFNFVHPDDVERTTGALDQLQAEVLPSFENRYRAKDGSYRTISWVASPEEHSIYAYGRDITDAKAREAELAMAQEALRQSQKMEAMGQLTGGVAHDFNNLLTPIVGALDMLQRKEIGGQREQRLIAGAALSAERAKTLVQRLLSFARRQPLQAVPVDIGKLVSGMSDLVSSTTGPQVKVVIASPEGLPAAMADQNQLEMALLNLSVNARDAMPDGGTLRIAASAESVRPGHRSRLPTGHYLCLSVSDTGAGMDAATLARAVEPFFSTKGVGKGTGLGLSMVHGLASQLNGALTIQSRPGLGTNVEFWLPRSAVAPAAEADSAPGTEAATAQGTALLVDDEELVRASTADMLNDLGYSVVEAASAEDAIRLFDGDHRFDLVVTDHLMPGMTGVDLARAIKALRPALPVLLVSGYAQREGVNADLPRLTKPFRKDELAASLSALPRIRAD